MKNLLTKVIFDRILFGYVLLENKTFVKRNNQCMDEIQT